jgi:hypothetical protein
MRPLRSRALEKYATQFPSLARRRQRPVRERHFDRVLLGHDPKGRPIFLPDEVRLEHMCTRGTTGSGKSTHFKNLILQDVRRGRPVILIDFHGSHPGSVYSDCLSQLYEDGFFKSQRLHLIDPNLRQVIPLNPLARVHNTDLSVIADALLRAFEIAWGAEDTHAKPTIRTVLRSTFMALAELNLPLADAKLLYEPHDPSGLRARVISQLSNDYARDELKRIHQAALDDKSKRDFNALVLGPINRIAEFVAADAIAAMFSVVDEPGKPRRTLDLLDIMDAGHCLFVNCQHGEAVSEADATLLAAIILRNLALLAPRRTNREPLFVHIDESHRCMVGDDMSTLFTEMRKFGVAMHVGTQFEAQAGPRDELTAQALENCTEVKVVFRAKDPEEAQRQAERVIPLTLERPVTASIRKTVVGHRKVLLASRARAIQESTSHGEADTEGESYGTTTSTSRGITIGESSSHMTGSGEFSGTGETAGLVFDPQTQTFFPTPISQSEGSSTSRGSLLQSASVQGSSRAESQTRGEAETRSLSRSRTRSIAHATGSSETRGDSEALEPIYADLPSTWHSKENEIYFAGELIRQLPTGQCFVAYRGKTTRLTVPAPKRKS